MTKSDVARMALDRGLRALLEEQDSELALEAADSLPHDGEWMVSEAIPPFEWGRTDPSKGGDPILLVPGRGAFVVE